MTTTNKPSPIVNSIDTDTLKRHHAETLFHTPKCGFPDVVKKPFDRKNPPNANTSDPLSTNVSQQDISLSKSTEVSSLPLIVLDYNTDSQGTVKSGTKVFATKNSESHIDLWTKDDSIYSETNDSDYKAPSTREVSTRGVHIRKCRNCRQEFTMS